MLGILVIFTLLIAGNCQHEGEQRRGSGWTSPKPTFFIWAAGLFNLSCANCIMTIIIFCSTLLSISEASYMISWFNVQGPTVSPVFCKRDGKVASDYFAIVICVPKKELYKSVQQLRMVRVYSFDSHIYLCIYKLYWNKWHDELDCNNSWTISVYFYIWVYSCNVLSVQYISLLCIFCRTRWNQSWFASYKEYMNELEG